MYVKVPEVKKCCFCVPLRPGIIIFGYLNIVLSIGAIAYLIVMTELRKVSITHDASLELVTSSALFSVFGMGIILNILLLVAGIQKDISMLRLYSYYAIATALAAFIPTSILLSRLQYLDVCAAFFVIGMQCYVIVLVRSVVLKWEKKQLMTESEYQNSAEAVVCVPEHETLISIER